MIQFDQYFSDGWLNHQLVEFVSCWFQQACWFSWFRSFQWDAFVTLPRGLSVLGRFGEKKADENNALQGGVGAEERFVATLKGQELNEWKVQVEWNSDEWIQEWIKDEEI